MKRGPGPFGVMALAIALAVGPTATAGAANPQGDRAELEQRVEALEQELALVRRQLEPSANASKPAAPVLSAGSDGFQLRSSDARYVLKLRGYTQFDARFFADAPANLAPGQDSFFFRTIRPILEGTLAGVVDFQIMPDFAGSQLVVQDAWANLRYLPEAQLEFGKFKAPVGLERLQSPTNTWFVERALPTQLVPNRDLGLMLQGVVREGLFSYQLGWLNGTNDNTQTSNGDVDTGDDKDLVGRVFLLPFQDAGIAALQGLGLGFAATYGREEGTPGSYKTSGQQTFFAFRSGVTNAGVRYRYAPQAYWYWGPFGLLGEYVYNSSGYRRPGSNDVRANDSAWQLSVAWALTGENESYKGLLPSASFEPSRGSWGAFEAVARISQLKVDDSVFDANFADASVSTEAAKLWSVGINWYLNRNVKLSLDYDRTTFRSYDGNPNRHAEGVILSRFQLAF
jgi:phosphate-selective porin OprO and OprP